MGGGAEPSTGSPLQGVNVDDVELSEIVRHLESSNPDNSTSSSVYSPTGGEGHTVDEVGVDLPQLDRAVEETLPSGLSREGIAEWIRVRHINLELRHLKYQIRYTQLLGEKYRILYKKYT